MDSDFAGRVPCFSTFRLGLCSVVHVRATHSNRYLTGARVKQRLALPARQCVTFVGGRLPRRPGRAIEML
jgi:hypothetical protein